MKKLCFLGMLALLISVVAEHKLLAGTVKTEIVSETVHKESQNFCSKRSAIRAQEKCQKWVNQQRKSLGDRVLTFYCEEGEQAISPAAPCSYRSLGSVSYILKSYRTETRN